MNLILLSALYGLGAVVGMAVALFLGFQLLKGLFYLLDKLVESEHRNKIVMGILLVFLWFFYAVIFYTELS